MHATKIDPEAKYEDVAAEKCPKWASFLFLIRRFSDLFPIRSSLLSQSSRDARDRPCSQYQRFPFCSFSDSVHSFSHKACDRLVLYMGLLLSSLLPLNSEKRGSYSKGKELLLSENEGRRIGFSRIHVACLFRVEIRSQVYYFIKKK